MKAFFLKDRFVLTSCIAGLLINLSIWIFLFLKIRPTDLPITLHYNVYFGVDYMGRYTEIYIIPIIGAVVFCINILLGNYISKRSKISSRILAAAIPVSQALLLAAAIAIAVFNL